MRTSCRRRPETRPWSSPTISLVDKLSRHRIMAAGHPRISFELDLFSSLQAHHQEDADYGWRKFGAANRRIAAERFDESAMVAAYENLYGRALKGRRLFAG